MWQVLCMVLVDSVFGLIELWRTFIDVDRYWYIILLLVVWAYLWLAALYSAGYWELWWTLLGGYTSCMCLHMLYLARLL